MKLWWLLAIFLTACAPLPPPYIPPVVSIDPQLQPYVNDFVADAASVGRTITIANLVVQFAPDLAMNRLGETIGECKVQYYQGNVYGNPTILIAKPFFEGAVDWSRHTLMYHELGHCVLFRVHRFDWFSIWGPDLIEHYIASSIMYPYILDPVDAQMFATYYVSELLQ